MNSVNSEKLKTILSKHGHSLTMPRITVFNALINASEPKTITELAAEVNDIDKVSVYRTLHMFSEIGIVHRVWNGFKSKIELSEEFSPHHHHFTCVKCGTVTTLKSDKLETSLHEMEVDLDFELTQHSVELSGYCANCKENKTGQLTG
jgi:Fur family ferric uptake transcriptional regulator